MMHETSKIRVDESHLRDAVCRMLVEAHAISAIGRSHAEHGNEEPRETRRLRVGLVDRYSNSYFAAIGMRRPLPKARAESLMPGGIWRRLYSLRSNRRATHRTVSAGY